MLAASRRPSLLLLTVFLNACWMLSMHQNYIPWNQRSSTLRKSTLRKKGHPLHIDGEGVSPPDPKYKHDFETKFTKLISPKAFAPDIEVDPRFGCVAGQAVVYVKNRADGFERRKAFRRKRQKLFGDIPVIFVIGRLTGEDDTSELKRVAINEEADNEGDILIGNFEDTYSTLTFKSAFILDHFVKHCNASYLISIDDDTNPDITGLLKYLDEYQDAATCLFSRDQTLFGYVAGLKPRRPRGTSETTSWFDAWAVSTEVYPWETYPSYCTGACYAFARLAAEKMHNAASNHQMDPDVLARSIDDVFITGVIREMAEVGINKLPGVCHTANHDHGDSEFLSSLKSWFN